MSVQDSVGLTGKKIKNKTLTKRRFRSAGNAFTALICSGAVGLCFGGYLVYCSFYAPGWHTHKEGTYYIDRHTKERVTGYQVIDNVVYLFDDDGIIMEPGWQKFMDDTYYLSKDGIVQRGTIEIDGEKYYFSDESGIFRTGLCEINGDEYYFDDHGFPDSGFTGNSYFDQDGRQVTGWAEINGSRYYFMESTGQMAKGFIELDGKIYYFNDDGKMVTDWQVIEGRKYKFNDHGALQTGWIQNGKKYYYADENGDHIGACAQGFIEIEGKMHYFDSNAEMVKGWKKIDGLEYHFADDGVMTTGWYEESPYRFYFFEDGHAAQGFTKIDKEYYDFNEKYRLLDDWQEIDGLLYYFGRGGVVASGWEDFEGDVYYFFPETHEAAYGWTNIDKKDKKASEEFREMSSAFKKEVQDLRKYENMSNDDRAKLKPEELAAYKELEEKYKEGTLERYQKEMYEKFGGEVMSEYYFYSDHTLAYGWIEVNGVRFHFDEETGRKSTGWQTIDGKRYYFGETGAAAVGEFRYGEEYDPDKVEYMFGSDGALSDGVIKINGEVRCKGEDGEWITSDFHTEKGKTYYFNEEGIALKGWQDIEEKRYFFDDDCVMQTGLYWDSTGVYYLTKNGMVTDKWVTFENGDTYYFSDDGTAAAGWREIKDIYYHFSSNGHLDRGWTDIGGTRYYLQNGVAVRGPVTIEGTYYNFGEQGYLTEGWISWNGQMYYNDRDGRVMTGWQEIDGRRYYFDYTGMMVKNTEVDGVKLGSDGAAQ